MPRAAARLLPTSKCAAAWQSSKQLLEPPLRVLYCLQNGVADTRIMRI